MPDPAKKASTWREENSVSLKAHVAFIEEHGTLSERLMASPKPGENVREEQAFREYNDAIKKFGCWSDGWRSF